MNIRVLIMVVIALLIGLMGFSHYLTKKHEAEIAAIQAEAEQVKADTLRFEQSASVGEPFASEQRFDAQPMAETYSGRISHDATQEVEFNRMDLAEVANDEERQKNEKNRQLEVYGNIDSANSKLSSLLDLARNATSTDRDEVIEKIKNLRTEVVKLDTANMDCANQAKAKLVVAIDAEIQATQAYYNQDRTTSYSQRNNSSIMQNAEFKLRVAKEQARSCYNSLR